MSIYVHLIKIHYKLRNVILCHLIEVTNRNLLYILLLPFNHIDVLKAVTKVSCPYKIGSNLSYLYLPLNK